MSVHEDTAAELVRLEAAKADIAAYITEKGVEVPEGTALDGFRTLLDSIVGGGLPEGITEMTSGTVTYASSTTEVSIEHGMSESPKLFLFFRKDSESDGCINYIFCYQYTGSHGGYICGLQYGTGISSNRTRSYVDETTFAPPLSSIRKTCGANAPYYWIALR